MKKRNLFIALVLAIVVVATVCLAACDKDDSGEALPEYTVTFMNGGGVFAAKKVKSGEKVAKPDPSPEKAGYYFIGWYYGTNEYNFDVAVTSDFTLVAKFEKTPPVKYTVQFDTAGGTAVESKQVETGDLLLKPANPTKTGCYFEGWFVNEIKFDFSKPVTGNLTLTAKWSDSQVIDNAFIAALAADYSNFTSTSTYTDSEASFTDTFKQTADMAYWKPGSAIYEEHLIMFGNDGKMLAMYYLHGNDWLKSNITSYADFVVALDLENIVLSDVEYSEGVYHVLPHCIASVVYALFRSNDSYTDFYFELANGRISTVGGTWSGDEVAHVQRFYDFGNTEIDVPATLPAVNVQIDTKNKVAEEGVALDWTELINFLFAVKVEGKDMAITSAMINLGGLDLTNPVAADYTVTITFETWDGAEHTQTATVEVKAAQADETFADIFAKDYGNCTITYNSTTYLHVGNVYAYTTEAGTSNENNLFLFAESDGKLTKYQKKSNYVREEDQWLALPRLEMLFALDSALFAQVGESNEYVAKNNDLLEAVILKNMIIKTTKINKLRDYSITLTVEAGRISKIVFSYYTLGASVAPTASNGMLRTATYVLSEFGTTEVTIPQEIQDDRA